MGKFGKNIIIRTLSGIALLAIVLATVIISEWTFLLLALTICLGCMWEFFRIAEKSGAQPQKIYPMAAGAATVILSFLTARGTLDTRYMLLTIPLVSVIFIAELYRKRSNPLFNISAATMGILYTAMPMSLLCFTAYMSGGYSYRIILAIIFTVWMNDIFAYLTGVAIGKHRLFERISPKKSWEGFFGGLIFATAFAVLCGYLAGGNLILWSGFGIVVVLSAVFGDLLESLLKRAADMKDSGSIIPGHGGFLDRFDALLLAIPFVFVYFIIFAPLATT